MSTATVKEAEVMTDFQFKAILNLVIDVVREMKEPDKIVARIEAIRDGKTEYDSHHER